MLPVVTFRDSRFSGVLPPYFTELLYAPFSCHIWVLLCLLVSMFPHSTCWRRSRSRTEFVSRFLSGILSASAWDPSDGLWSIRYVGCYPYAMCLRQMTLAEPFSIQAYLSWIPLYSQLNLAMTTGRCVISTTSTMAGAYIMKVIHTVMPYSHDTSRWKETPTWDTNTG